MNEKLKAGVLRRLRIIEGQVRGLQSMVEGDAYCVDIITQNAAVKEALSTVENLVLENHVATHVVDQIKSGREHTAIEEIMKAFRLSKKR